jgi:ADP-heptose:LPS heptosyltransferase
MNKKKIDQLLLVIGTTLFSWLFRNRAVALPLRPKTIHKILLIKRADIGESMLGTAVINFLKDTFPEVEIDLLVKEDNAVLFKDDRRLSRCFMLKSNHFAENLNTLMLARRNEYDLVFAFTLHSKTADGLLANFAAPKAIKLTDLFPERATFYSTLYNSQLPINHDSPIASRFVRSLASAFGIDYPEEKIYPSVMISQSDRAWVETYLQDHDCNRFCVLNISGKHEFKKFIGENCIAFIAQFLSAYPEKKLILVSSREDESIARHLVSLYSKSRVLYFKSTILRVAALLSLAEFVVTTDSALAHIAASLERPIVCLCVHHTGWFWFPYKTHSIVLKAVGEEPTRSITSHQVMLALKTLLTEPNK